MYKVIVYFEDLQDEGHPYNVGDAFPRKGLKVGEERIKELSTAENRRGKPLIEKGGEDGDIKPTKGRPRKTK